MLTIHLSLAAVAVTALALRGRRSSSALIVAAVAIVDLASGASGTVALTVVGPVIAFLTAALTLAAIVAESGLIDWAASWLAECAHGSAVGLYLLVCGLCVVLTLVISLDGAVVLMVPLVLALHRDYRAPLTPSLVGVVAVANASSIALPQGNPTNLVVVTNLQLSPLSFAGTMLAPGLLAAALCVAIVWLRERRQLAARRLAPARARQRLCGRQWRAAAALLAAAIAAWTAPLVGLAPWWPFIGAVALAVLVTGDHVRVSVPWRIAAQVAGLAVVVGALGVTAPSIGGASLPVLIAVALASGAVAALVNNLPASVWAATLLNAGPLAYGATIGLAIGALAAPQGSIATMLAADLAGDEAPALRARRLAPAALVATIGAAVLLAATL